LPKGIPLDDESKNNILIFHSDLRINSKPYFHAWIRLSDNSLYDGLAFRLWKGSLNFLWQKHLIYVKVNDR